jgi:iron-sulfur cluster insertion protein
MILKDLGSILEMTPDKDTEGFSLRITDRACGKIASLYEIEKSKNPAASPYLQLKVEGGGCSGFQYHIGFSLSHGDDEIYFHAKGIEVGIDLTSLEILSGSVIDYEEDMIGSAFSIKNPNATSSCGCGNSFSVM